MARMKAPFFYFMMVYAAGFALGTVREFFVTPYLGLTAALWIELPVMAVISSFAARFVIERASEVKADADRLFVGCAAFILLLIAEDAMSRILRGISIFTLWADFEPLAAIANILGLVLFMLMPLFVACKRTAGKFG